MPSNRPNHSSSLNKEKQTVQQIHGYLLEEVQKIAPKEDADEELKKQFELFVQLIDSLVKE